ncbi:MAG: hypothetical protein HYV26_14685 [Candidatus Hydrogenedentes bacterium]|nr:hypothetical protein [Candidatus Hydrogenedentota bacterium]
MKSLRDIEYIGWGFWIGLFVVLAGPFGYLSYRLTYETATVSVRVGFGIFLAAAASAFITFVINDLLHRRNVRHLAVKRKEVRKERRKKRKKS